MKKAAMVLDGWYEEISGKVRFYMSQKKMSEKELARKSGLGEKKIRQCLSGDLAQLGVDYSGEIETICDWELKKRFEEQYITFPHPFRRGDIVEIVGTNTYGVVMSYVGDEDWERYDARCKATSSEDAFMADFSDVCVTVETLWGDTFGHEHVYPYQLEYAAFEPGDVRVEVLESASRLVRGRGGYRRAVVFVGGEWGGVVQNAQRNGAK